MFGIGFLEICVIAIVVIVFVGPKKLPEMMRHVGKFMVQAKKMTNEVKSTLDTVVQEAERELHLENIKKINDLTKGALTNPLGAIDDMDHEDDHQHHGENDHDHQHGDDHQHDSEDKGTLGAQHMDTDKKTSRGFEEEVDTEKTTPPKDK